MLHEEILKVSMFRIRVEKALFLPGYPISRIVVLGLVASGCARFTVTRRCDRSLMLGGSHSGVALESRRLASTFRALFASTSYCRLFRRLYRRVALVLLSERNMTPAVRQARCRGGTGRLMRFGGRLVLLAEEF